MAEGADPDADKDRHKKEFILQWRRNVELEMAHPPRVSDGGLTFNPDPTSYYTRTNPIGIAIANPMQAPLFSSHDRPHPSVPRPPESSVHPLSRRGATTARSQPFSRLSRPVFTSSLSRRQASQSSTEAMKTSSTVLRRSPLVPQTPSHGRSVILHKSEEKAEVVNRVEQPPTEGGMKETSTKETTAEEHRQELRSLTKTRQSSLSPLPVPTAEPSLPTFNLSGMEFLPVRHTKLKKKLPTISGMRTRKDQTSAVKLVRATTSPSEFSLIKVAKSAPSSPRPARASKTSEVDKEGKTELREENESPPLPHDLERQKSFSHDDIGQLKSIDQLGVGGVSPAQSHGSCDGDAPSTQQSLVVEEGSSEEDKEGEKCDDSCGKMESFSSDDALPRSDNEGSPFNQSLSSVEVDRAGEVSVDQSLSHQPTQPDIQFAGVQEDQKKVSLMSMCPISSPSLSSPRTPHSPLIRQRHISRSPSPTNTPSSSPFNKYPHSSSGTESRNVISKQMLKLHENRTFSFDTSDETDMTTLSKQPKFLRNKAMRPEPTCPITPPPLLSPPSSHHTPGTLSQFLSHHTHSRSDNTINHRTTSPTQLADQSDLRTGGHVTSIVRSASPILSDGLTTRRGSTPVTLSLTKSPPVGPMSGGVLARRSDRGSLRSVIPSRSLLSTPSKPMGMPKSIGKSTEHCLSRGFQEEGDYFKEGKTELTRGGSSEARGGVLDKTSVNRQDSGLGTLSTTSNKCDFRI